MSNLSIYFVLNTTFFYIDLDSYQGFKVSNLTDAEILAFGELASQVRSTEFESCLRFDFRDKFSRTILKDSDLHRLEKQRRQRLVDLNVPQVGGGEYPTVIWNLILYFARSGLKVTIDERTMTFHRFHPVRFDWYQHIDHSRMSFGYVRDRLYNPKADQLDLVRNKKGEKGFTVKPVYLPRCSPVFEFQLKECTVIGYFAATGVLYVKDIPRDQSDLIDYDNPMTWKYTTPAPITLGSVGVWKKHYHRGYNEYNQRCEIYVSYSMNRGTSINDLSVAPNCRHSNGTYYISRSLSRKSIQAISVFESRFNGFHLHLSLFEAQYGESITTAMFYPSCLNSLHQVSFIMTANNTLESLRSQMSIPLSALRTMENRVSGYEEPYCKKCDIGRMCRDICGGPVISEQKLQVDIEVCLVANYPPRVWASTTKRGYFGFYHYLRQNFPDLQVFAGVYVDEFWLYHGISRGIMPEIGKNSYFPCLVQFDSAVWADANTEEITSNGVRRRFEADCYSSDGGYCCFEEAEEFDGDEEPPRKRRKVENGVINKESEEDDDDIDLDRSA